MFQGEKEEFNNLVKGIVHECDRMLRIEHDKVIQVDSKPEHGGDNNSEPENKKGFPWKFYMIYAHALLELGLQNETASIKDDATLLDYVDTAIERLQQALEITQEPDEKEEIMAVKCRAFLLKVMSFA